MNNADTSASGYITDSFEGINRNFTDIEVISTSETNIVAKAKRYGRWWLLKGITRQDDEAAILRLRKEFEMTVKLQHPNVIAVSGLEDVAKIGPCIVMEYVEGTTLKEWLTDKHSRAERRNVAHRIAQAVAYIHSMGVIHRDLKPSNIIISNNGDNVKIIDFGLADTDDYSLLKQPAGTISYMAPEQLSANTPDVRNDIYSIGMIFREMDLGYGAIIHKCTCDITNRYPTATALIADIQRRERLPLIILSAIAACTIVISAALAIFSYSNLRGIKNAEKLQATVDALNDSIASMNSAYSAINDVVSRQADSLSAISDYNKTLREYKDSTEQSNQKVLHEIAIYDAKLNAIVKKYTTPIEEFTWAKRGDATHEILELVLVYRNRLHEFSPQEEIILWQAVCRKESDAFKKMIKILKQYHPEEIPEAFRYL